LNLHNVRLESTAVRPEQFPDTDMPEVAFIGKSNVGKSSLINSLLNRKKLAFVGSKPGRTRVINFYNVDDRILLVDLPGYGFANVPKTEQLTWKKFIESYLYKRTQLKLLVMLVDIRHKPGENDILMYDWVRHYNFPCLLVATKSDKLPNSKISTNIEMIRFALNEDANTKIIPYSINKNTGRDILWEEILSRLRDQGDGSSGFLG